MSTKYSELTSIKYWLLVEETEGRVFQLVQETITHPQGVLSHQVHSP